MKTSRFASRISSAVDRWIDAQPKDTRAEVEPVAHGAIVRVSSPERFVLLFVPSDLRDGLPLAVSRPGAPASQARRRILELARSLP